MSKSTYQSIALSIAATVEEKQAAYGDAFGKSGDVLRILYPQGIPPEKMDDAAAVVRIVDKLFRIATDKDALGESPYRDISGYGLLGTMRVEAARAPAVAPSTVGMRCTRCKAEWTQQFDAVPSHLCPPFEPQT